MRDMVTFGAHVTAHGFVNYFARNLDNILVGRFLGAEALGYYSRAYQLLMLPYEAIRDPINSVAFPAMSRLQDNPSAFRQYYCKTTLLLAFASMPATAFLFVASEPLIDVVLGPGWSEVSRIFALLAIAAFVQPVASLRGNVLLSSGQGIRYLQLGIFEAVCVSIGFLVGIHWGTVGVAGSYAIVNYLILYPSLLLAFKDTPLRPVDFFGSVSIPFFASLAAASVCLLIAHVLHIQAIYPAMQVVFFGGLFSTIYILAVSVSPAGRRILREFVTLLPSLKRRSVRERPSE
jgi:PST family polysaccharide transporter